MKKRKNAPEQKEPTIMEQDNIQNEISGQEPGLEGLLAELQANYDELKESYDALNDKYLRMVAEFDNYRKRTAKERLDLVRTAGEDIMQGLLPVLDDFRLAQETIACATDMQAMSEGVDLIYRKLYKYLESKGLQPIKALGLPLDTDEHEAVSQCPVTDKEQKGKIIEVLQPGYVLNGKVIRYAKVVVGV